MMEKTVSMTPPATGAESAHSPAAIYAQRCTTFGQLRDRLQLQSSRNANVSLLLIGAALVMLGAWLWQGTQGWLGLGGLLFVGFIVSYIRHGRVDQALRRARELYAINYEGQQRLRREWSELPLRQPPDVTSHSATRGAGHNLRQLFGPLVPLRAQTLQQSVEKPTIPAFANDLDLLGYASLQHLLNTAATPVGQSVLRDWLLNPADAATILARQAAVQELAVLIDFRDELALRGRLMTASDPQAAERPFTDFLRWAEGSAWLPQRHWLLVTARGLPILVLLLVLGQIGGWTAYPIWLIGMAIGLLLTITIARSVDAVLDTVAERQTVYEAYAHLFQLIRSQHFSAPALLQIQYKLSANGLSAAEHMHRLARIIALAELRRWMFFFPIQLATLWNVHVLWLLERWQSATGRHARSWLLALGECEALAALAALAHDNPEWCFPELAMPSDAAPPLLIAQQIAHPLLPGATRVGNDVEIGPPGTFLLVTGSNMSGKSTLLRAIGMNVVLAQAGGPACAAHLRLPPLALATSIRVQDSLEQGVSYFMAELQRLKDVVDAAEQAHVSTQRTLLFLLDEILHGTNTSERQVAARHIIVHLLSLGAIGAVSTHDLNLADAPELSTAHAVHFTEHFTRAADGLTMSFDYLLRPGIATSTNALKLMEMLGLPVADAGKNHTIAL